MAQIGQVVSVEFNVTSTSKGGKSLTQHILKWVTDKGQAKTEKMFTNVTFVDVIKGLAPGDTIEVSMTKNGDYFNLSNVILVAKGDGKAPEKAGGSGFQGGGASGRKNEDPERQASIERQNALTNAVSLLKTELDKDMFKKGVVTSDFLIAEAIRIAAKFHEYTSGKAGISAIVNNAAGSVVATLPVNEDEIPF